MPKERSAQSLKIEKLQKTIAELRDTIKTMDSNDNSKDSPKMYVNTGNIKTSFGLTDDVVNNYNKSMVTALSQPSLFDAITTIVCEARENEAILILMILKLLEPK